jgi:Ca-activated chloride channel homolog
MIAFWSRFELVSPLLLLAAPVAVLLLVLARGRGRRLVRFSSNELLDGVPSTLRVRLAWLPAFLLACGVVLAAIALSRPRLGDERTVVRSEGIAIALAVDLSSSMLALDLTDLDGNRTDRLTAVKSVVREFVQGAGDLPGRPNDAVGLTVFAGYADAVCPLTLDHRLLLETLDAQTTAKGQFEDGTSIGQGLAVAVGRLEESEHPSRVVILLTDGRNNDDETDPMAAAEIAREKGIKVYTVAVGTHGVAPYPVIDEAGNIQYGADGRPRVRPIRVDIDEGLLTRIAEETGGLYQRAGSTDALRGIYAEIDRLERTEVEGLTYRRWRELYAWPLAAGALCWMLSLLLDATWLRRLG